MTLSPTYTKFFKFIKQAFDTSTWHDGINGNFDKIDAVLGASGFITIDGTWANSTLYTIGFKASDPDDGSLWRNLVVHTSPATGSFADYRAENPSNWGQVFNGVENRGDWLTGTVYSHGDIVSLSGSSYLCLVSHTAGTFALDLAADYWQVLAEKGDKGDPGTNGTGSGNVNGPVSSVTGNIATFANVNGDTLLDSGIDPTTLAALSGPTFTGVPKAPTAAPGTNTTQIATTEYVTASVNALINAAPGALDTLNELATALGDDPNFSTTVTTALATKWTATLVHGFTAKTTLTANDQIPVLDSASGYVGAIITFTNLIASLAGSLLKLAGNQTITGGFDWTASSRTWSSYTIPPKTNNMEYGTNTGAITITAPASDCVYNLLMTNGAGAAAPTMSGFSVGTSVGDTIDTTSTHKFFLQVIRINGVSTYRWAACQ